MENYKKILIFIIILIICIILLTALLLTRRKEEIIQEENPQTTAFQDTEKINNKTLFFQIDDIIKTYLNYVVENDQQAINALSPSGIIQLDASKQYTTFTANEMYTIDKINNITVFVKEYARQFNTQDECYLVINMDYSNNTYEIAISSKEEYENAKNNIVNEKYKKDIFIESNQYNSFKQGTITDFSILKKYFDDYKFNAINNPEVAFKTLDAEYRKAKFNNNVEQFKTYIKNNINTLQDANIVKHGVTKENGYTKYTFVDNYENYYELKETGIYEYTIILDNYTLQTDEQVKTYNTLSDEQKALSNMDKVMKLIDQKDYATIYSYLNEDFKNTNFPSLELFTKYINENFFDNNIVGSISIRQEGNVFVLLVPYKEGLSSAAEEQDKTFIMKLKEGTDFELSFEI